MSEGSKERQWATSAQSDNIVDVDRAHHDDVPRSEQIVSPEFFYMTFLLTLVFKILRIILSGIRSESHQSHQEGCH